MALRNFFLISAVVFAQISGAMAFAQTTVAAGAAKSALAAPTEPQTNQNLADMSHSTYRLDVADKVRLIVFNELTLSGEFTVNSDGVLSLPLIGDVKVRGLTTKETIDAITAKFADGYLNDPKVNIDVLTYRPFYILGEVTKPGEYPYSNGLTVMNAVATAQGFTYRANNKNIFIKRAGESKEARYRITPDLAVRPGDTVRVGERYF